MGHLIRLMLSEGSENVARCGWDFQKCLKALRDTVGTFRRFYILYEISCVLSGQHAFRGFTGCMSGKNQGKFWLFGGLLVISPLHCENRL